MTLISIITVNLNNASGLRRTLRSIAAQSDVVWECIIVDGMSTDESPEIAHEFQSGHGGAVQVIHEPDSGIYDAMNKGIRRSSGGYLVFMNSGDSFASADSLSGLFSQLANSGRAWGYGRAAIVDRSGTLVRQQRFEPFRLDALAGGRRTIPHQAAIFKRSIVEAANGYRTDKGVAADQELMFRLAVRYPPAVYDAIVAEFELGGVGSARPPRALPRDFYRYRRDAGYRLLGLPGPLDWLATHAIVLYAGTRHVVSRALPRSLRQRREWDATRQ